MSAGAHKSQREDECVAWPVLLGKPAGANSQAPQVSNVRCKLRLADALLDGEETGGDSADKTISLCGEVACALADEVRGNVTDAALDALVPGAWEGAVPGDQWVPRWRSMLSGDGDVAEADVAGAAVSKACEYGRLVVVRGLLAHDGDRRVDVHVGEGAAFCAACQQGQLDVVRHLLALTGDRRVEVHADDEAAFRQACWEGQLDVVRHLLGLTGDRTVDVNSEVECAFRNACWAGHLDVVRELLALSGDHTVDVHVANEAAFRQACQEGHLDVVCELLDLTGDRRVDVHAQEQQGFRQAYAGSHLDVVLHLLALSGDRLICPVFELNAGMHEMLASGLGDPHSPAVAAAWRAISSPEGMMCNAEAGVRTQEAAAAGYRVHQWRWRGGAVLRRQGGGSKRSKSGGANRDGVLAAVGLQGHGE